MALSGLFKKNKQIGLALGGGGARGLAHIGVLKVLEEEGIAVDYVAGTSAGSIIGALFCAGYKWHEIKEIASDIKWSDLLQATFPIMGLLKHGKLRKKLNKLLSKKRFEDLDIPFCAVAADIRNGEQVVFSSGPVPEAVVASCSIPGIFEPTTIDGRLLVDGGLVNNVPADVVRAMGANLVIAVDLSRSKLETKPPKNIFDVIYYSFNILINNSAKNAKKYCDFMIVPEIAGFGYHDLKHKDELILKGEKAIRKIINKIMKKI